MQVGNNYRASLGWGQAWHGTSCDSQDKPQEISIKILFHMEELPVILPFHGPMLQLPPCGLDWKQT